MDLEYAKKIAACNGDKEQIERLLQKEVAVGMELKRIAHELEKQSIREEVNAVEEKRLLNGLERYSTTQLKEELRRRKRVRK